VKIKKLKVLGIIPARKGSKGIPNKNFVKIRNNKRLIDYTIIAAKKSKLLTKIALTTDDDRIINHSKKYKIDFMIKRQKKYSTDYIKSIDVVYDVLKKIKNYEADLIMLLQPTSPLRKSSHIDESIELLYKKYNKYNSLVSVSLLEEPHPYKLKKIKKNFLVPFIKNTSSEIPRQKLDKVYKLNGAIYLIKKNILKDRKTFFNKTMPYIMSDKYSLNIDTVNDLKLLKKLKV
jgi:CMP-N,N'-diacetyllegionaminic acid synthase